MLDKECAICSCTEQLTQVAMPRLEPVTRRTKLELHEMQMMLSLVDQLKQKAMKARQVGAKASSLYTELPDFVTKAIVALPRQALPVLLLVGAVEGNAPLLAPAIAAIAMAPVPIPVAGLCGLPEGQRLDACHLSDQPIQCLHLQKIPRN